MKQRQYITTFSLIVALTGLSPLVAADAGGAVPRTGAQQATRESVPPPAYALTAIQLDGVHAGRNAMDIIADWAAGFGVTLPNGCHSGYCTLRVTP